MTQEYCHNCGYPLSAKNVELAAEDAALPQDALTFFCPTYGAQEGKRYETCRGYSAEDRPLPAYWRAN